MIEQLPAFVVVVMGDALQYEIVILVIWTIMLNVKFLLRRILRRDR